ncbi:MAG: DUF3575 domain-containing protein [Bacteroidota bacterium]
MKKIVLALCILVAALNVNAQNGKNVVKVNPLGLLFGIVDLTYERGLNENSSFEIVPQYGGFTVGDFKYSTIGLGANYKYYSSGEAVKGFYLSPGLFYSSGKVTDSYNSSISATNFGIKAVFGKQWIWESGFALDLNGGFGYQSFSYSGDNSTISGLKGNGIFPSLRLGLGYNF